MNVPDEGQSLVASSPAGRGGEAPLRSANRAPATSWSVGSPEDVARRALDVGRRTALGVLAGDVATADDVSQDVAIQALRHVHRLRDPQAFDAWLYRTAVRAALKTVRRGRRQRAVEQDHVATSARAGDGDDDGVPTAALEELGRLLRGLPERQRAALTLRYAHDLDDDQIAAALGCRAGTVRALLSRGRTAVRARLEDDPRDARQENLSGAGIGLSADDPRNGAHGTPVQNVTAAPTEGAGDVTER